MNAMTPIPEPQDAANDQVYTLAAAWVIEEQKCSTAAIQRRFSIGYNRAARLVERMEQMGIVSAANHLGKREVVDGATLSGVVKAAQTLRDLGATVSLPDSGITVNFADKPAPEVREEVEKNARKGRAPMKKDADFMAHNDKAYAVTADELRQFIERIEQKAAEIAEHREEMKTIFAEAKGRGYDNKAIRKLVALRKRTPEDIAEEEAILDLYKSALGMS